MINKFTTSLFVCAFTVFGIFGCTQIFGQGCNVNSNWTFDPPIPPSGIVDAGTSIEMCVNITAYAAGGANWMAGVEFDLPPAYDISSISDVSPPISCSGNGGTWIFMESITCGSLTLGPGFYYDSPVAGPLDGNPCNNWGDPCFTNTTWQFCFTVTLDADCGGGTNPFDGTSIVPGITVYGDGEIGNWGLGTGCLGTNSDSPNVTVTVNCCDAEAGVSPGTLPICENGTYCLFDELGAPVDAGGFWTGPMGWIPDPCGTFDPTTDPPGEYIYFVSGSDGCINSSTITMEYISLGVVKNAAYCATTPADLDSIMATAVLPPGGTWYYPGYPGTVSVVPNGIVDPDDNPPGGQYTYEFYDNNNCKTTALLSLIFSVGGNSGEYTVYDLCTDNPTQFCPLAELNGAPLGGGQWIKYSSTWAFQNFYPTSGVCFDASSFTDDFYFVYILGSPPCAPGFDTLEVHVFDPVVTGAFTEEAICITDAPFVLETLIEPTADLGYNWIDLATNTTPVGLNPATNIFDPSAYPPNTLLQLEYSGGLANTVCYSSSLLSLTILPADANAGADATITVCETDPSIELITQLLDSPDGPPQPGGVWTNPNGANFGNFYTPGNAASIPGLYTYTLTTTCDQDVATLMINQIPTPNPGISGTLDICNNATNVALIGGLTGAPQTGGTWYPPGYPGSAALPGNTINGNAVSNGAVYTYVVGTSPCELTSEVTLNVIPAPFAGTASNPPTAFCDSDAPIDLFQYLNPGPSEMNASYWGLPSGTSVINPATAPAGTNTYTYTIPDAGCGAASASVTITIEATPNAGADVTVNACPNGTGTIDLFAELTGATSGGLWSSGNGTFIVGTDTPGNFTYTVSSASGQCLDEAVVTVALTTLPNPGTNTSITVCESDAAFDLISVLNGNPAAGGSWDGPSNFNPAISGVGTFSYTYELPVPGCNPVSAILTINVLAEPNAGSNTTEDICETAGVIDLIVYLPGATPGGTWTNGGPNYDVTAQGGNTVTFDYTVDNGTCSATSTLTLNIENQPNAGCDGTIAICADASPFSLFDGISCAYDNGGVWTNSSGTTVSNPNGINPANIGTGGTYTYTVSGTQCAGVSAQVVVTVTPAMVISNLNALCTASQTTYTVSFDISGGSGTYVVNGPPAITGSTFTSAPIAAGTGYNFTISDPSGGCADLVVSGNSPNCNCPATASFVGGTQTICIGGSTDLQITLAGVAPYTVEYSDGSGTNTIVTLNPPNTSITVSPTATTSYSLVSVSDANCTGSATGSVTVNVDALPNAGIDVEEDYCGDGSTLTLVPDGSADSPGSWSPGNTVVLNAANSGTFTYTVDGGACPDDAAIYTVNIDAPISVSNLSVSCEANQTQYVVTGTVSGGTPPYSISQGTVDASGNFNSGLIDIPNAYSFVLDDTGPCAAQTVSGNAPNCNCPASASITTGNQTICLGSSVDIQITTEGATPVSVSYTANGTPQPATTQNIITVSPTVTTTYVLTDATDANCTGSANGSVTITVETPPIAGPDVSSTYCGDGSTLNLPIPTANPGGTFNPASLQLLPANSGTVVYTVPGNQCPDDAANYNLNIIENLAVNNVVAVCESNQTEYTVTLQITGGTPPYMVNGVTTNSPYSTTLDFAANPSFNFVISDNGPCQDVVIDQIAPDCNCIAQGSFTGSSTICQGDCAQIVFNGIGDAPFDITYTNSSNPGMPTTLTDIVNGHVITVCPSAANTYTLTSVSDQYCEGVVTGSPVNININQPIVVSGITEVCDGINENYQVQFNVTGGVPPYNFSPSGVFANGVFTSNLIASGQGYNFTVGDAGACPSIQVTGAAYTCACISDAGSITSGNLEACDGESITVAHSGEVLDGNDYFFLALHSGTPSEIGTILESSETGVFNLNSSQIIPGVSYYITAIAGNATSGGVLINDECTDFSNSITLLINDLPTATISGAATVCPGVAVDLTVTFDGEGPWDYIYAVNDVDSPSSFSNTGEATITTTQPGTYTITAISDNNCSGAGFGSALVANYVTPTATLSGDSEICENSGDGPQVSLTGNGPWNFVYAIDGEIQDPPISTNFPNYTIPAEVSGNYSLVSLDGPNCPGTVSGSLDLTINQSPSATITGGGTVCAGEEATFNVALGGNGPWTVQYTVDGIPQSPLVDISNNYSFQSGVDGDYVIVNVVDDDNCTGDVLQSQAVLNVNPLPTAEFADDLASTFCIGEEFDLAIDLEGVAPYDLTYVLNGDTITVTGVYGDYFQTLQQSTPITAEIITIEDGSNPTCSTSPMSFTYIDAVSLPNAPVLTNDTVCAGVGPISIGVPSAPGLTYSWSPQANLSSASVANPNFVTDIAGRFVETFTYVLTASNGSCSASDTVMITVDPGPQARFTWMPKPVTDVDPTVYFENNTIARSGTQYFWEFDSLNTSVEFEPSFKFPAGINDEYTVTLTAIDPSTGCMDEYSDIIKIKPELLIFVPNAFTPDSDGLNDLWGPATQNIDENDYRLTVFDRYGGIVFSTTDVNKKWNGSMAGDDYYVESGVYVWLIETKNALSLEEVEVRGHVTVLR